MPVNVRVASETDRPWISEVLRTRWGGTNIVVRGVLLDALALPALVAEHGGQRCGLATYALRPDACEIITLDALEQHSGVGTALLEALAGLARQGGVRRLVVQTTNDNVGALRFYQRRGFHLTALHPDAIAESRKLKPSIAALGCYGIPIRDEIELARPL